MTSAPGEDPFWTAADQRRLAVQGCGDCGLLQHPPRPLCPSCGSPHRVSVEMSGRATLYSWTAPRHPILRPGPQRIAAVVALEEGPRLVTALEGVELADLSLEQPLFVDFAEVDERLVPVFRPVG